MVAPSSLQQFIDSAELPTLVLDFRILQSLDDSTATISDVTVSRNATCKLEKFKDSVESLLARKFWDVMLNPGLQIRGPIIGAHTQRYVNGQDIWTSSRVGPYRVWTLQLDSENSIALKNHDTSVTEQDGVSGDVEPIDEASREQQLFNKLDHIHGPLKAFCHLADQALSDIQKSIKDLTSTSSSRDVYSELHPVELNLRTLSSGLSLLKDLSDISSFTPEQPQATTPKEAPSDQALLSKILSRVHLASSNSSTPYKPSQTPYVPPDLIAAHLPTLRALIIEDNKINSKIATRFCQKMGVLPEYITPAFDGAEALEILEGMERRGCFPDIIFVDTVMPVMAGMEFLEEYNRRWPGRRTRIIGMTAHIFLGDTRMERLGANLVLQKPLRPNIFKREMEKAATLKMTREIEFRGKL
ncbi:hypothetical protein TWF730_007438 [Orbilia blumenaviensis]|uniref:Response regulatory domain-containing protein n=1 Tax=Orbilia blumenaviensis TaxID=1796055 RepID=A0AAV9VAQ1_9PEZI